MARRQAAARRQGQSGEVECRMERSNDRQARRHRPAHGAPGKGILAADESTGTIEKRFDSINIESRDDNRRDYREMLFSAPRGDEDHISGVILFDETIRQKAKNGTPLVDMIKADGAIPGIKVDKRRQGPCLLPGEKITEGLDGLARAPQGISRARRRIRQMARGDRHRRRHSDRQLPSTPMPMRWPAMRRSARQAASCRSSSPKC